MKIPKALLGAILIGVTAGVSTTSCTKKSNQNILPHPQPEAQANPELTNTPANQNPPYDPSNCPACGMG